MSYIKKTHVKSRICPLMVTNIIIIIAVVALDD